MKEKHNTKTGIAERRKFPRLKKNLRVELKAMDSLEEYKDFITENVSLGGFKIEACFLDNPLQVNQIIEVIVSDPCQKNEPIKAIGRVAWLKENPSEHTHEIGIHLTYIKEQDKDKFKNYLDEPQASEIKWKETDK